MKSSHLSFIIICILSSMLISCKHINPIKTTKDYMPKSITIHQNKFVDNQGRHVILNGINVISKSKKEGYLVPEDSTLYPKLRDWGYNSVRFGIIWDGIEPEPGVYNEEYLIGIDKHIKWAADNNVFVVLDMHQDLYSVLYADGAPEWATIHEDKPHTTGDIWSDAYMLSGAVQTAFDNFWANTPASDGIGLQDHYAEMWKHIAKRYANNPNVIGYDLMNEPFPGSSAIESMSAILVGYGTMIKETTGNQLSQEELENIWGNVDQRTEALKTLTAAENFAYVVDALYPSNNDFESNQLQPFYQKVSSGIREVDTTSILFLEHSYLGNVGVRSSIQRTLLANGSPDPLIAYAPHGYDLVTDTENAFDASFERLSFIYNRFKETANVLNMPVWLGEWGAFYRHDERIVPVAQHAVAEIARNLFGNAYWSYETNMDTLAFFQEAFLRPYPAYTNGELLEYNYNQQNRTFTMSWFEDKKSDVPTMVFIPNLSNMDIKDLDLDQSLNGYIKEIPSSKAGWLIIPRSKSRNKRELEIIIR